MRPIKWGILGTSFISEVMANAIQESEFGQLQAIGSRSIVTAEKFANKYSLPKYYAEYQALLDDKEIDAIYIGLPNHLHKEWVIRSAQAGKNVLCEKPFAISVADAREMITAVETTNIFCMEALMYRCHPFIKKLQELIQSKIIGEVKLYHAVYTANIAAIANATAGGSIRNLGCYPISLVRLLADAEPIVITGTGRICQKSKADNQASVMLKFADDAIAVVSTADDLDMFWQFEVYGTKGRLQVVTNPWLPSNENNKILIYSDKKTEPVEVIIRADKSLYNYQIDEINKQIMQRNTQEFAGVSLADSLANTHVLETWLQQIN